MNNPVSILFKLLCFFGVSLGLLFIFGVLGGWRRCLFCSLLLLFGFFNWGLQTCIEKVDELKRLKTKTNKLKLKKNTLKENSRSQLPPTLYNHQLLSLFVEEETVFICFQSFVSEVAKSSLFPVDSVPVNATNLNNSWVLGISQFCAKFWSWKCWAGMESYWSWSLFWRVVPGPWGHTDLVPIGPEDKVLVAPYLSCPPLARQKKTYFNFFYVKKLLDKRR